MTDKELLEAAAKAAGIGFDDYEGEWYGDGARKDWNPLTDDGDALRLAVKLDIAINVGQVRAGATWWVRPELIDMDGTSVDHNGDPYAATRRAIVRAAAEIGRAA